MAKLSSWKTNGKISRVTAVFNRAIGSVSRGSDMLGLTFPSPGDHLIDDSKERDFSIAFHKDEVKAMLKTIFNDLSQTQMSQAFGERKHDRLFEDVLNDIGIYLNTYRVKATTGHAFFQTHYYVRAVNPQHALKQLSIFKPTSYDPGTLELVEEKEG